jgi:TonB family protein
MLKHYLKDEKILSLVGTTFFHILLVCVFLIIQIKFNPIVEEFTEVSLAGGFEAPPLIRSDLLEEESPEAFQKYEENSYQTLPEEIDLPERRQLTLDEQEILEKIQPQFEKIVTPGNILKKSPEIPPTIKRIDEYQPTFTRREKEMVKGLFKKELDEKLLQGTQKLDINVDRNFEIDWEGEIKREIYQKRLPEFPPDVQREATIKIQFSVLPNGLVGSAILLQKGDNKLENITVETFKTWRFNPLPEYVDQVQQTGVITFHFKLR